LIAGDESDSEVGDLPEIMPFPLQAIQSVEEGRDKLSFYTLLSLRH
jgi:hypothetical protein